MREKSKLSNLYEIKIKWISKKMRNLFCLKSKNPQPTYVIQQGMRDKENDICETKRNVETRWEEHSDKTSEASRAFETSETSETFEVSRVIPPTVEAIGRMLF